MSSIGMTSQKPGTAPQAETVGDRIGEQWRRRWPLQPELDQAAVGSTSRVVPARVRHLGLGASTWQVIRSRAIT